MTKEALLQRKAELEAARQQHMANANAAAGAIQDCEYWIEQLEKIAPAVGQ